MVDVFVMALFVTFLGGQAGSKSVGILIMEAQLESGFYFFLSYYLFSLLSTYILEQAQKKDSNQPPSLEQTAC